MMRLDVRWAILLVMVACGPAMAERSKRIVSAAGVHARRAPSVRAPEVATLSLGTVSTVLERSNAPDVVGKRRDYWYHLALPQGRNGWVFGGFTLPYDGAHRDPIHREIAAARLKDAGSFGDSVELVEFSTRAAGQAGATDEKAELELDRLLALQKALAGIPFEGREKKPFADLIKRHRSEIVYSEPSGQWLVRADQFWGLRDRNKDLPLAERIAWEAASQAIPGECETDASCHLALIRMTDGRYLELYPSGAHAAAALQRMGQHLGYMAGDKNNVYAYPPEAKKEMRDTLAWLRRVVTDAQPAGKASVLKQLDAIGAKVP